MSVSIANGFHWPWKKDDPNDPKKDDKTKVDPTTPEVPEGVTPEPELPEEEEEDDETVPAGVVVSLGTQFLIDEQPQMLKRLINALNWMGDT